MSGSAVVARRPVDEPGSSTAVSCTALPLDCAALILHHLPTVRDRCIAMSASSFWRAAGRSDITLWRELKLNVPTRTSLRDAHVDTLIVRADGQVQDLTLGHAPELTRVALRALCFNRDLRTLSVRSPLISGSDILDVIPRDASCVSRMHISGCKVDARELRLLQEVTGNGCDLDLELCEGCDAVGCDSEIQLLDCAECGDDCCARCAAKVCSHCTVAFCSDCADSDDADMMCCEACDVRICEDCADNVGDLISSCALCPRVNCHQCERSAEDTVECSHCGAWVCEDCISRLTPCDECGDAVCCNQG